MSDLTYRMEDGFLDDFAALGIFPREREERGKNEVR